MRSSFILLELIICIILLSFIGIYTTRFTLNIYESSHSNLILLNTKLDFQSTYLFIETKLKHALNVSSSNNKISFYEEAIEDFKSNIYSGFINLDISDKTQVLSPNSQMIKSSANYIWFENNTIYEIEQSFNDDLIVFKNTTQSKTIYEHYKLIKRSSSLYLQDNMLFYNGNILLNNVKTFDVKKQDNKLYIEVCQNRCQDWVYLL